MQMRFEGSISDPTSLPGDWLVRVLDSVALKMVFDQA